MNKDVARKWAEALESGEYRQGTGALTQVRKDGEYDCCLGVLCKLAIINGIELVVDDEAKSLRSYDGFMTLLPNKVVKWAELSSAGPILSADPMLSGYASASRLNDGRVPFDQIANMIRDRFEVE